MTQVSSDAIRLSIDNTKIKATVMSIKIGIGKLRIGTGGSQSWESYWANQSEVLFFGLYSEISGGQMPNKKTGSSDYLTVAGVAGSETYQCPNTAPYIAADTDYIWFKTNESQRTVTTAELIGYDLQRTPVKYEDESPNEIVAIIILNAAVTGIKRDNLFRDMWLSVWWDDSFNDYGHIKDNRGAGQQLWTPEAVYSFYDTFTDTNAVKLVDHTPDIGGFTWIDSTDAPNEKWKVSSNKAIITVSANTQCFAYFNTGSTDVDISVDMTVPDAQYQGGFIIRRFDNNGFWRVALRRATDENCFVKIYKYTTEAHSVDAGAHSVGTKTLRVVVSGNNFSVYWGGVLIVDSYVSDGSWNAMKIHGLAGYYYTGWSQVIYDNFKIV